jgi:uncharacterized phage protein gp47/JayE
MSYTPPTIGSSGLTIPNFNDILQYLITQYQAIYGASVYLGSDSPDYQDLAIRALQATDAAQCLQAVYNGFNPQLSIGAGLDLCGRIIGPAREAATYSTAQVTLSGTPGTVVTSGTVQDVNGNYWNVASPATIGSGGTVTVPATAQQIGNITANPGDISQIASPTSGWTSVTNGAAASPGAAIEPDSAYRARLLISQALPSSTLRAGTEAAIAELTGVTRSIVYENQYGYTTSYGICNTANTDAGSPANSNVMWVELGFPLDASVVGQPVNIAGTTYTITGYVGAGITGLGEITLSASPGTQTGVSFYIGDGIAIGPAHSITAVVEGGAQSDIAQAIYNNRGMGPYTCGTTSVVVTDANNAGTTMTISFYVLAYTPIYVTLNVHRLGGFTSAIQAAIQAAVVAYLNALGIGQTAVWSEMFGAAVSVNPNPNTPLFSVRSLYLGTSISPSATADVPVAFDFSSSGSNANVTINLV